MFSEDYLKLKPYITGFTFDEKPMYDDFGKKEVKAYLLSSSSLLRKEFTMKRVQNIIDKGDLKLKVEEGDFVGTPQFIISSK